MYEEVVMAAYLDDLFTMLKIDIRDQEIRQ
jgi:hypothetical protein